MSNSLHFVAGIVKGLVEHEDYEYYFGSTIGIRWHLNDAIALGFLDNDLTLTAEGYAWYESEDLRSLPEGRAYMWNRVWSRNLKP